jgi:hypothetical protein
MSGTHEVKVSVTEPPAGAQLAAAVEESPEDEDEFDEQAVIERVDKSRTTSVRRMSTPDFT